MYAVADMPSVKKDGRWTVVPMSVAIVLDVVGLEMSMVMSMSMIVMVVLLLLLLLRLLLLMLLLLLNFQ